MNEERLKRALQQIHSLAAEALGEKTSIARRKSTRPPHSRIRSPSGRGLPAHIIGLRDGGFFKGGKTAVETHAKLQPSYHCDLNRVAVALLRLQKRKLLRKASKLVGDKKHIAYGW
jgi:hypothetical protein